jgi:hypothetical protein
LRRTGWVQCVTYGFGLAGDPGEHARAVLEDVGGGDGVQRDVGAQVQRRHPARALHCTRSCSRRSLGSGFRGRCAGG